MQNTLNIANIAACVAAESGSTMARDDSDSDAICQEHAATSIRKFNKGELRALVETLLPLVKLTRACVGHSRLRSERSANLGKQ